MRIRKAILVTGLLCTLAGAWVVARALLVARAVSAPSAKLAHVVVTAVSQPYEMAAPHQSWRKMSYELIPSARAQTFFKPACDCTELKVLCVKNVYGTCCNCPDCVNGPCTQYTCQITNNPKKKCDGPHYGQAPCQACRLDKNVPCESVAPDPCLGGYCP